MFIFPSISREDSHPSLGARVTWFRSQSYTTSLRTSAASHCFLDLELDSHKDQTGSKDNSEIKKNRKRKHEHSKPKFNTVVGTRHHKTDLIFHRPKGTKPCTTARNKICNNKTLGGTSYIATMTEKDRKITNLCDLIWPQAVLQSLFSSKW